MEVGRGHSPDNQIFLGKSYGMSVENVTVMMWCQLPEDAVMESKARYSRSKCAVEVHFGVEWDVMEAAEDRDAVCYIAEVAEREIIVAIRRRPVLSNFLAEDFAKEFSRQIKENFLKMIEKGPARKFPSYLREYIERTHGK